MALKGRQCKIFLILRLKYKKVLNKCLKAVFYAKA